MIDSEFTVINLVNSVINGKTSVKSLTDCLIARVGVVNQGIHAFTEVRKEYILDQAKSLDQNKQDGCYLGKLYGVPIAVSDNISTSDFFTEQGSKIYKGQQLSKDATVVLRLRNEGAVIFGKTNLTEFSDSEPTITLNPHNQNRSPGGSASGAAASVAAGLVPLSVASQNDGSIITSASYCGVYGFKPTNGLVPRTGLMTKSTTFDSIGFFSRSIEDIGYVMEVVSGDDGLDSDSSGFACGKKFFQILSHDPPFDPKFLYAKTPSITKLDKSIQKTMKTLCKKMSAHLTEIDLPKLVLTSENIFKIIYDVELSSNLSNEYENHKSLLSPGIKRKIRNGKKITGYDYLKALGNIEKIRLAFNDFFEHFDAIITPSTPSVAPLLNQKITTDRCLSTMWSLSGFPMINLPMFNLDNSMPFGIQLVGRPNDDARLLRTARWLVNNFGQTQRNTL